MKSVTTLLLVILLPLSILSQVPQKMSYQAVIRDAQNDLITSRDISVEISLLQGSPTGSVVYFETHSTTTNPNGLFSLEIGTGKTSSNFSSVDWSQGPYWIRSDVDPGNGEPRLIITTQLMSVPYALYANNGFSHYIGERFGGGIICHLWKDSLGKEHGLIIDLKNINDSYYWGPTNGTVGGLTDWNGLFNSEKIASRYPTSAAALCLNSTRGGYDDWYLPTFLEIQHANNFSVYKAFAETPGAQAPYSYYTTFSNGYWVSEERDTSFGLTWGGYGWPSLITKDQPAMVRAMRKF